MKGLEKDLSVPSVVTGEWTVKPKQLDFFVHVSVYSLTIDLITKLDICIVMDDTVLYIVVLYTLHNWQSL